MTLDIENINPLDYAQWDKLILESNLYSFFHSNAWIKVLRESYGYKPLFFILKSKSEGVGDVDAERAENRFVMCGDR